MKPKAAVYLALAGILLTSGCISGSAQLFEGGATETPFPTTSSTPEPAQPGDSGTEVRLDVSGTGSPLQDEFSRLYGETIDSVVSVTVYPPGSSSPTRGTGFIYDEEGHVVTNQHVVSEAGDVEVTFHDGVTLEAEVVGSSLYKDLAVLKVDPAEHELQPLPIGDSTGLEEGDIVLAIGNPLGFSGSMSHGIVSATGRSMTVQGGFSIPDVVQTDAAVNPGNSGGPLVTLDGEVVGVNRAKARADNIGFAISSRIVERVVPSLIEEGSYRGPWIGIGVQPLVPAEADIRLETADRLASEMGMEEPRGLEVVNVRDGSPAAEAGLRGAQDSLTVNERTLRVGGDVIVGIGGVEVRTMNDLALYLATETEVGDIVEIDVIRDGEERTVELELAGRPDPGE